MTMVQRTQPVDVRPEGTDPDEALEGCFQGIFRPTCTEELRSLILSLSRRIEPEWRSRGYRSPELRARMVLEEAMLNAWHHGNKEDPQKAITVRWYFNERFHMEVQDEGEGFDVDLIPDPTRKENLCRPNGRGIFIIRHFSRQLAWEDRGRRVLVELDPEDDSVC
jgi:hypothetical protein